MKDPIIIFIDSREYNSHEKLMSHISEQLMRLRLTPAKKPVRSELEILLEELKMEIKGYMTECAKECSEEEAFVQLFREERITTDSLKMLVTIEDKILYKMQLEFVKPASRILLMTVK